MVFPFPFSILMAIFLLGLSIAWVFYSKTHYFASLLALNDALLRLNWIFLLPYLLMADDSKVPALIIAYCLFATLITNLILWRLSFKNSNFDPSYEGYVKRYPCLHRVIKVTSYSLSFQVFRLTYSQLLGKKCFSANFGARLPDLQRILGHNTILSVVLTCLPALAANIYGLCTQPQGT